MGFSRFQAPLRAGFVLSGLLLATATSAQIVPDATLPNNSIVDSPGCTTCTITGGTPQAGNLFHSFSEFSIPTGGEAFFDNAASIENIFSRVTGNSISNIDGLIRTNDASLLLLNPNGFLFGENAALDINGSFFATSATSINFDDGAQFSTQPTNATAQLTVTAPVGLGFASPANAPAGSSPGSITVEFAALELLQGETLALVGGDLSLIGPFLFADGGRVELGSVGANSEIGITALESGWQLDYRDVDTFQDIDLTEAAFVDVSGDRSGEVQVQGRRISMSGDAGIFGGNNGPEAGGMLTVVASERLEMEGDFTGIFTETFDTGTSGSINIQTPLLIGRDGAFIGAFASIDVEGDGGQITVNAPELVEFTGTDSSGEFASGISSLGEVGNGGSVSVTTGDLILRDGAQFSVATFGSGDGGNLTVNVADLTELSGTAPEEAFPTGLFAQVEEGASGNGGTLRLNTSQLIQLGGAQISSTARSDGAGGTVIINASDSVLLSGTRPSASPPLGSSGIFASAELGSTQNGGSLSLTTPQLTIEQGAKISVDTFGEGQAGTADIRVERLVLREGGVLQGGSFGNGSGNNLVIDATESVTVEGIGAIGDTPVNSALFTAAESTGNGGDLFVTTPQLTVRDGGQLTAGSTGQGRAGDIVLVVPEQLRVTNADIRTDAAESAGGSITITGGNIRLTGDGDILTNVASGAGNGGSITINANSLIALDDSDILAFAQDGAGGNITLPAFFGQNFQPSPPGTDPATLDGNGNVNVDASGRLASGTISFPDVSFIENSLSELPDAPIDTDNLVSNSCIAITSQGTGRLIITGADGLPAQPGRPSLANLPTGSVRSLPDATATSQTQPQAHKNTADSPWQIGDAITEPQNLYRLASGRLVLSRPCS